MKPKDACCNVCNQHAQQETHGYQQADYDQRTQDGEVYKAIKQDKLTKEDPQLVCQST